MEISTVGQCVLELILNSLDAKTTGVAVRFHTEEQRIQVVDCGEGIPPDILTRIGEIDKKNGNNSQILTYCPYLRGKSLKSIIELSQICIITSRCEGSTETYEQIYKAGETPVFLRGSRPAKGTSITICGFQGSGWDSAFDAIRFAIESVALIYIDVSFTLHNQMTGELAIGICKPHEPYDILAFLCDQSLLLKTTWHLNSVKNVGFKISGYIGYRKPSSTTVRHIFVNRRPMMCLQIQNFVLEIMDKLRDELQISSEKEIYFLIYIECSFSDYVLSSYRSRTFVVFQNWQKVKNIIKLCIMNTIAMNHNVKPGTHYGNAEKSCLEENKNYKREKFNPEEIFEPGFNSQLEENTEKAKQIPIAQDNQEPYLIKQLKNKQKETKHVSFFPSIYRHIFEKILKDEVAQANPLSIFKKNHKTIFRKKLEDKIRKVTRVSKDFKEEFKEEMFDLAKLQKLKNQCLLMDRIQKYKRVSFKDNFELFDKSFLQSLASMKSRIFKKPIKSQIAEETNQINLEKTFQPVQKETLRVVEKVPYHLSQEELHLLNQMDTDQRILKATNQLQIQKNKEITDLGNNNFKLYETSRNLNDIEQNKNIKDKEKSTDLNKDFERRFDAGEKTLQLLIHLSEYTKKIDSDLYSQLSDWSDWNYEGLISKEAFQPTATKESTNHRLYVFLPTILNPMLRYGKTNIISRVNIQNDYDNICSIAFNPEIKPDQVVSRYQNLNVRPCVVAYHSNELILNRKSLYSIQILNQINLEFIAALTNQDGKKLLLMIDQHAADERVRYEDLLQMYRIDGTKQYFSVTLNTPILINDLEPQKCELLLSNETLLKKFGIRLKSESPGSLKVSNIPRCFLKRRNFDSDFKMVYSVRNLLLEIVESLNNTKTVSILPKSIHNAIASEACRGAVKFGDPLTIDQCDLLIQALRETNAPNRCAHGRPSIIPLLDITDLKKKQTKTSQGKLNFASLKKPIKNT